MNERSHEDFDDYDFDGIDDNLLAGIDPQELPVVGDSPARQVHVMARCSDERLRLLIRLLEAHEVRLPPRPMGTSRPVDRAPQTVPVPLETPEPTIETGPAEWRALDLADEFDPWEEPPHSTGRKAVRSMV